MEIPNTASSCQYLRQRGNFLRVVRGRATRTSEQMQDANAFIETDKVDRSNSDENCISTEKQGSFELRKAQHSSSR